MLQIKEALKQRGLKQNDLAERLGINRVSLSRLLSDKNDMRISTIKKIADAISCDVAEFFSAVWAGYSVVVFCFFWCAKLGDIAADGVGYFFNG